MGSKTLESTVAEISEVKEKQVSLWIGFISPEMWSLGPAPVYVDTFFKNLVTLLPFKIAKMSPLTTCH